MGDVLEVTFKVHPSVMLKLFENDGKITCKSNGEEITFSVDIQEMTENEKITMKALCKLYEKKHGALTDEQIRDFVIMGQI